ncbi:MAG TPA: anthrone oxygenase family protein [Actinoplanes sp.]|nr:anthrone oxygenase family protein [Actinoplanes sp.]
MTTTQQGLPVVGAMSWSAATLLAGTVTTGLMAGLFAAFSYAVMPGLARTDDATFVAAMQRINVAILNPVFGLCFGGALVLTALALALHRGRAGAGWILAGLLLYVAVLVVTFAVNVPLNNRLNAATGDPAAARAAFEAAWVRWNAVRSLLSTAALGCLGWALTLSG